MSLYRKIELFFLVVLAAMWAVGVKYGTHWWAYSLVLVVLLAITIYASVNIRSGLHLKALCNGNSTEKQVAITFDDGPVKEKTEKIVEFLNKRNVKAAFFCIGKNIEGNEAVLKKIVDSGHIVGNHSFDHSFWYDFRMYSGLLDDIEKCNMTIRYVTDKMPKFFRPPYGVLTPSLAKAIKALGFDTIGWDVRSLDTSIKDSNKVIERVTKRIKPGSILLFHDTTENIEEILSATFDYLNVNGYKVVELDKLLSRNAYA